ncbi:MAG: mechanosensitive ion channel family protein [Limnothrix sp. RL_2_0]|nr:mechanosensitive ion channel family protein [Limnothrix sp. RL_2_0]
MKLRRSLRLLCSFGLAAVLTFTLHLPALAGFRIFNVLLPEANLSELVPNDGTEIVIDRCVYLDGRCLFKAAAPRSELATRLNYIQTQLGRIKRAYRAEDEPQITVSSVVEDNLSNIVIDIDGEKTRLMTVTRWDAELHGEDVENRTEQIIDQVEAGIERLRVEQDPFFLKRQGAIAGGIMALVFFIVASARSWQRRCEKQDKSEEQFPNPPTFLTSQLTLRRRENMREVKIRLSQLIQSTAIATGIFFILGLFPLTRIAQIWLLGIFRYPVQTGAIFLIAYLAIRLSYASIAKFNELITAGALDALVFITQESDRRVQLRVDTFSQVMRSVVTLVIMAIALVVFLWSLNIDIAPILAGAGIIGLAISFAAQNLLKDIINGFCIILEDQYAVGDVIGVGDVSGFVENMNLRITQIRDQQGRLITIPNSEVRIVANFSNEWARADLNIPIPYQTDVDLAIRIIGDVAREMQTDEVWQMQILEDPLILGVDNFHERGMIIKLWIKTLPLKQWDVSREYRRRLKNTLEAAGIQIPSTQSEVWLHPTPTTHNSHGSGTGREHGDRPQQLSIF